MRATSSRDPRTESRMTVVSMTGREPLVRRTCRRAASSSEAMPLVRAAAGIEPEAALRRPEKPRRLRFATNHDGVSIVRVRSFDVATFVAFGAAHIGICGRDVLMEFDFPEIYAPLDLGIGAIAAWRSPSRASWSPATIPRPGAISASPPNTPTSPSATSPPAACRPNASS